MATQNNFSAVLQTAAAIAPLAGPAAAPAMPYLIIGTLVAQAAPEILDTIKKLLAGQPPTPDEEQALQLTIARLYRPETL
jgi:hypothetical protein